jgi:hypothetical protein
VISLDCIAAVVTSRNRAGVICQYVSLSLSIWWCGRVKETLRGTMLTINALLYNLVQWAIGWFDGGTVFAGGVCLGRSLHTLEIGARSMSTLGAGAPTTTLGGGAIGVTVGGVKEDGPGLHYWVDWNPLL